MLRRIWLFLGWLWVVTVFYVCLIPHPPQPVSFFGVDKLEHFIAYAGLMLWFCQVYPDREHRIRLFIALVAMGVAIEFLQRMTGYRTFEYVDMLADAIGVAVGWGLARTGLGKILAMLEQFSRAGTNK